MNEPEQRDSKFPESSTNDDDSGADGPWAWEDTDGTHATPTLEDHPAVTAIGDGADQPKQEDLPICESSTNDDDCGADGPRTARPKPWWEDHPELEAIRARVAAEIYGRPERPESHSPDPVLADYLSGDSVRELRYARDGMAAAKTRYANAVIAARNAGLSWAQIGVLLGVTRQQLHRRFRHLADP